MVDHDETTRRTVLKSLGVAAGVGAIGAGQVGARMLDGPADSTDVSAEASLALDDVVVSEEWPQLKGNAAKTGVTSSGPRSNVSVAWQFGADDDQRYSSPIVSDSVIYAATTDGLVSLTTEGEERWTLEAAGDKGGYSLPAVADGVVYVASNAIDTECGGKTVASLVALDTETGDELWRTALDNDYGGTPTVTDEMVYVVTKPSMTNNGDLFAVDAESGEKQWRLDLGGTGIANSSTPPVAVADGVVYVAADDLYALDAESGDEHWAAEPGFKATGGNAPTVVGDTLYVGGGGDFVYAFDTVDGSIVWKSSPGGSNTGSWVSATVAGGYVVFGFWPNDDGSRPKGYYALNPEDGSLAWSAELRSVVAPAAAGDLVYTGRKALNADDGSVAWEFGDDAPFGTTSPAVVDDTVYVGGASLTAITGDTEGVEADETA